MKTQYSPPGHKQTKTTIKEMEFFFKKLLFLSHFENVCFLGIPWQSRVRTWWFHCHGPEFYRWLGN